MNRLAEIETFIAVVDAGSQLAAAQKLNVAVSAVHRRITDLEARLGVALTHRTAQGTALTHFGQIYYERCLRIVADLNDADSMIAGETHKASGLIRMAVPQAFDMDRLAPVINDFAAANPEVRFDVDVSDRPIDLVEEQYDLAVRIDAVEHPQLDEISLFRVRYFVCASPTFWQKHGTPRTPKDLTGLPALVYRGRQENRVWHFRDPAGKLVKVPVSPRLVSNQGAYLVEAAKAGLGVALEPEFVCGDALKTGELVSVLDQYSSFDRFVKIVRPTNRPPSLRVQLFIDVLRAGL